MPQRRRVYSVPDKTQFLDSPSSGEGGIPLSGQSGIDPPDRTMLRRPSKHTLTPIDSLRPTALPFRANGSPPPHEGPFASGIGLTASPLLSHQQLAARDKEQNKKAKGVGGQHTFQNTKNFELNCLLVVVR